MGIMSRIVRSWKADLHGVMDDLEDKGLLLRQCLREMEDNLQQTQRRMDGCRRACEQIQSRLEKCLRESEQVETDLHLAVREERDDLCRMSIRRRLVLHAEQERLRHRLTQLDEAQRRLAELDHRQQEQYAHLKARCAVYCQQPDRSAGVHAENDWCDLPGNAYPTEEMIDLELLRYKETIARGGAQ